MRNFTLLLSLVLIGLFFGCKKQNRISDPLQGALLKSQNSNLNANVTVINGMLSFTDMEHAKNVMDGLYENYLNHEDAFLDSYPNMDGEELMEIEEQTGFREYEPYEHFENSLNFYSLRAKIESEIDDFLDNGDDNLPDPDDHFVLEDQERAILNIHAEVMIRGSIFKLYEWGYIEITDGDYGKLIEIRQNVDNAARLDNVLIVGDMQIRPGEGDQSGTNELEPIPIYKCKANKGLGDPKVIGSAKIKWRVAIRTPPWGRYVIAKHKNFIKKNNKWKKFRCHTKCRVWGKVSGWTTDENGVKKEDCDKELVFNEEDGLSSDKYNTKKWHHKINVQTKTQSGWVKGYHYSFINYTFTHNSVLTFSSM